MVPGGRSWHTRDPRLRRHSISGVDLLQLRRSRWFLAALGGLGALVLPALVATAWEGSRLPGTYSVMELGFADFGGGPRPALAHDHSAHDHGTGPQRLLTQLREPAGGEPDFRATLTARTATVRLASGKTVEALTFDGRVPGPELRVRQNELVEITLVNRDVERGVAIHWHGVDVPNAADGVAGVTQDAVLPGERYTYRFRARQAGTYWYHSHQASADQVKRGLYGAFVVVPEHEPARKREADITLLAHKLAGEDVLGASDRLERRTVARGTDVRLRLVNSSDFPKRFVLTGSPFRVVAIDGTDVNEPGLLRGETLEVAAGGRYDVAFTMPRTPVRLDLVASSAGLLLSPDGRGDLPAAEGGPSFDPAVYGRPGPTPFGARSSFDRGFTLDIDDGLGFFDGRFGKQWTINGKKHDAMPMLVVREGDLVKVTISSGTRAVHPMHLHGHHMLVLSRDGVPTRGSPWWVDTLDVKKGETYELAFRADNPGLWMFHCHNLAHAADGLGTHVVYEGVITPFVVGGRARNQPE
jgi:FtsP/CotA-like multicopper oxidase with cupredoxin domain